MLEENHDELMEWAADSIDSYLSSKTFENLFSFTGGESIDI